MIKACSLGTWEVEAGGSRAERSVSVTWQFGGQPRLHGTPISKKRMGVGREKVSESLGMPCTVGKTCPRREPAHQPKQSACLLRTRKTYKIRQADGKG